MKISASILRRIALTALVAFEFAAGPALAGGPPQDVVVFGDSLSDPGNVFALTGAMSHSPYAVIPSAPYAIGGHHFSNGKTWIEQRPAGDINTQSSGPAYEESGVFTNYAVGGARARATGTGIDLGVQVQDYLEDFGGARPTATHVLFIGGNDIRDALEANGDPTIIAGAVNSVAASIQTLYFAGARRFVVVNGPDLSLVPAVNRTGNPYVIAGARLLSQGYNEGLATAIAQLNAALPGAAITTVDLYAALNDMVANPLHYGLVNVSDMCIIPDVKGSAQCSNPDGYLFWDGIHPTSTGHAILANLIGAAL